MSTPGRHHARLANVVLSLQNVTTRAPVTGADVSIADSVATVVTNANGEFTGLKLIPGEYRLRVRKIGYAPIDSTIVVSDETPGNGHE
jgi:hypothetical protein